MFLDLLTFFGTFVAAGTLSNAFASDRAPTAQQLVAVVALCSAFEIVAFNLPFCSVWLELLCVLWATAGLAAIFASLGIVNTPSAAPRMGAGCLLVIIASFFPIVSFTTLGRVHHAQKMAEKIDGIILVKFRSSNHNIPSISLSEEDGSTLTIEGVDQTLWNTVSPGKTHLTKLPWSAKGKLDGNEIRVVPKSYVVFLGPFRD